MLTPAIRRRSRLDSLVSPFLVHRAPERRQRRWVAGKPHWTAIEPGYLSRAFQAARDATGLWAALPELERPSFHEIRGLGSRLCLAAGMREEAIQALMTHSQAKTTQVYLEGGREALKDSDFIPVATGLTLAGLGIK